MSDFSARVTDLCARAVDATEGTDLHEQALAIRERATGPLRVAIAGRVKAGKSTLLNALVSEKLAPTDAGECTLLVSEYREHLTYDVAAVLRDGTRRTLRFTRDGGALDVDLGDVAHDDVAHLDIGWPSSALRSTTLIDTPGLASLTADAARRTIDHLAEDDAHGRADAVLYLMRHLHRTDAAFLETFTDRTLANASPANAIAVLSRADEIGGGRRDAMASATRIADRFTGDARIRLLASQVVPVAGLLAETGLTLRQDEYAHLVKVAESPGLDGLLRSVDRFVVPEATSVAAEIRKELLDRLGIFGLRVSIEAIGSGRVSSAGDLARLLVQESGLPALQQLLEGHFAARAAALKGRSALTGLRHLARAMPDDRGLGRAIEELEATSAELSELRLVHLVLAGATSLTDEETVEVDRLTAPDDLATRLGAAGASVEDQRTAALVAVERWRTRRAHPMIDPVTAEACDLMARAYEGAYAELVRA